MLRSPGVAGAGVAAFNRSDPCSCRVAFLQPADLPSLPYRGLHPTWDRYLETVYCDDVQYPVHTSALKWFYRCDCLTIDRRCSRSEDACVRASKGWRSSCFQQSAPIAHKLVPRIWLAAWTMPACSEPFSEAFVGVQLVAHVWRNPQMGTWPNPEYRLAPYGIWTYPRAVPRCLPKHTWVEVIRRREAYEGARQFSWFYHAPGSGIWLNTGQTACVGESQRDSHWFVNYERQSGSSGSSFIANKSSLVLNGFKVGGPGIDVRLQRPQSSIDTMQRNGPFGNMLEIVDMRPEAKGTLCGPEGCTCVGVLRSGWNASRPCVCDNARDVLNCAPDPKSHAQR